MTDCEKYKKLLVGLIDQELTHDESSEIHDHLRKCASCRTEYDELLQAGDMLGGVSFREPEDELLASLWKRPYSRWAKISGLLLIIGGWLTLVVFALIEMFRDTQEPLLSRISVGAIIIGFIIMLLYVIRERMATIKIDKYKGVIR